MKRVITAGLFLVLALTCRAVELTLVNETVGGVEVQITLKQGGVNESVVRWYVVSPQATTVLHLNATGVSVLSASTLYSGGTYHMFTVPVDETTVSSAFVFYGPPTAALWVQQSYPVEAFETADTRIEHGVLVIAGVAVSFVVIFAFRAGVQDG